MIHMLFDEKPWFRQRRFGIGATPDTIEGWVFVGLYLLFVAGMVLWFDPDAGPSPAACWIILGTVSAVFLLVTWRKTKGGWRWRWGK